MKKLVFLFAVSSALLLTSFLYKGNPDYTEMAQDICDCVNQSSNGVPNQLKDLFIQSVKDGKNLETVLTDYILEDPTARTPDVEALVELGEKMEICSQDLEEKYSHVYSTETEDEVIEKVITALKAKEGCEFTYAIMLLGIREMELEE